MCVGNWRDGAQAPLQLGAPHAVFIGMLGALEGHWPFKLIACLRVFQVLLENYMGMLPNVKPDGTGLGHGSPDQCPVSCGGWPEQGIRAGGVSCGTSQRIPLCLAGDNFTQGLVMRKLLCVLICMFVQLWEQPAWGPATFWKHVAVAWLVAMGVYLSIKAWRS